MSKKSADQAADLDKDVRQINTYVSEFEHLVDILGGPKDTPEIREELNQKRSDILRFWNTHTKDKLHEAVQAYEAERYPNPSACKRIIAKNKRRIFHLQGSLTKPQLCKFVEDLQAAEGKLLGRNPEKKNLEQPADILAELAELMTKDGFPLDFLVRIVLVDESEFPEIICGPRPTWWVNVMDFLGLLKFVPAKYVRRC